MAMVGKDCVAIACDLRLGLQAMTVSNNFPKVFQYGPAVFLGLTGLATDVATVSELLRYKVNLYRLREERPVAPKTLANLVSTSLYERRFGPYFVAPVVAGLDPATNQPFVCSTDGIGCIEFAKDFVVSGTASDQLFGMCESLWEPDLVSDPPPTANPQNAADQCRRSQRICSRRSARRCSTRSTEMPCPDGARTCTLSKRTRSQRGCSRAARIRLRNTAWDSGVGDSRRRARSAHALLSRASLTCASS